MKLRLLALVSCCLLQSCILAPFIDSFSQAGVTKNDRMRLLGEEVQRFNEALYWGRPDEALRFARADARATLQPGIRKLAKEEKVVDAKVEYVDFAEDAYSAEVNMVVRSYKVPVYIVQNRNEKQKWDFSLTDGWKLVSREEVPVDDQPQT